MVKELIVVGGPVVQAVGCWSSFLSEIIKMQCNAKCRNLQTFGLSLLRRQFSSILSCFLLLCMNAAHYCNTHKNDIKLRNTTFMHNICTLVSCVAVPVHIFICDASVDY